MKYEEARNPIERIRAALEAALLALPLGFPRHIIIKALREDLDDIETKLKTFRAELASTEKDLDDTERELHKFREAEREKPR